MKDPELYRLWYRIAHEGPPDSVELIRASFHSRYVLCFYPVRVIPQEWNPFIERMSSDKRVQTYLLDDLWILFDLGE